MSELRVEFYNDIESFYTAISGVPINATLNTPFQYEGWQRQLYAEHMAIRIWIPYVGAILYCGDNPILGGHFFVKKKGKRKGIFFLGSGGETDYYDLIYFSSDASEEYIEIFLNELAEKNNCWEFDFTQIPEKSLLSKWAKQRNIEPYYINECAWVRSQSNFEKYFVSLSKSIRQNIRTANNRLLKDKVNTSVEIYDEIDITSDKIKEILELYEHRRKKKNKKITVKKWIIEKFRKYNKRKYNIISEAMHDMKGKILALYKIDSEIAAYCFGLKSSTGSNICIMQVAINDKYNKYSPGILLLVDVFKKMFEQKKEQDVCIDLTNGNEKYKYSLGAVSHYTKYYTFELKK